MLAQGAAAAELRIVSIDAPPWASESGGDTIGALPDLLAALETRTGHRLPLALVPFARIDRVLADGSQDCTVILWNDQRAELVQRGASVYEMAFGVVARPGVVLRTYDDLRVLTVSVIRDLAIDPRFDDDISVEKDPDKSYLMGLQKMAHRRVDAVAGALPTILYQAEQAGLSHVVGDRLVLRSIPITLQCAKTSPHLRLMADLDHAIHTMAADGSLARLLAVHGYR